MFYDIDSLRSEICILMLYFHKAAIALPAVGMMGPRYRCWLLLVLPLHDRLIHAFAPHLFPSRFHERLGSSRQTSMVRWSTSSRRTLCIMSIDDSMSQTPPPLGSAPTWHPARAMLSSVLASAIVLTGAVPGWEVASSSMERNPTFGQQVVPGFGVPSASAAGFNDEQRAIAETWVSTKPVRRVSVLNEVQYVLQAPAERCRLLHVDYRHAFQKSCRSSLHSACCLIVIQISSCCLFL